jgi:DNA-binding PadR family transcriptional regulator
MEGALKLKYKIGEVEFEAEGLPADVEKQRDFFMQNIIPATPAIIEELNNSSQKKLLNAANENTCDKQVLLETDKVESTTQRKSDFSKMSLQEYLNEKGNLDDQNFVLFAAYFHEQNNNGDYIFSSKEVAEYYDEARRPKYSNNSELLKKLAQKGYIMDAPNCKKKSPKQYIISRSGLYYVESYTQKEKTTTQKVKGTKKNIQKTAIKSKYKEITADDLHLEKYCKLDKLNPTEMVITVMFIFTEENKGEWFSVNDIIQILVNCFGQKLSQDQISNVFRHKKWFSEQSCNDNKRALERKLLSEPIKMAKGIIEREKQTKI